MEAIKKKMQAMKVDNAMDRCLRGGKQAAKVIAEKAEEELKEPLSKVSSCC